MEQMKISSAIKAYPNKFLLMQAVKRNRSGVVEMASIFGVCETKEEAFVQQEIMSLIGVKTFVVPTFEETEEALSIQLSGDTYEAKPLLTPADHARIYRQYYGWE